MRSLIDVSLRSGVMPASLLVFAIACQAGGGGSTNNKGSGATSHGASSSIGGGPTLGGSINLPVGGPDSAGNGSITSDSGAEITVSGAVADVHLTLNSQDGSPVTDGVTWSIDDTKIGSISGDGVFHANGYVGGVATIAATVGNSSLSVALVVNVDITNNDAKVTAADQATLVAGNPTAADAKYKFLYPYDGTVFPRGLAAPVIQLAGTAATNSYTTITAPYFSYKQFSGASTPMQVTIPEPVWKGVTLTAGAADDVELNVTKSSGGQVSGPVSQKWRIAQASMKGIIYYNTYSSPLTMGTTDTDKGGILRIKAGGNAEVVKRGCTVCHAVSADGSTLATGSGYVLADYAPETSATYNLSPTGDVTPRATSTGLTFPFAGLTPNGKKALTNGLPAGAWPTKIMRGVYSVAGYKSQLVDTGTGMPITSTGLNVNYIQTPAFSPDGKHVTYLNGDMLDNRVLSMMDFDDATNTFSAGRILVQNPNEAMAWPTFLPDASAIVYHAGNSFDSYEFTGGTQQSKPQYAELRMVEVETKAVKKLNALNGRDANGTLTLPYGEAVEGRMNYEPNVLPLAVGGYYWVLFTSRRTYGNTIAPGGKLEKPQDPWGSDSEPSLRKKVWIAAIDVDHAEAPDPSHPGFYLPGQELEGGNMRAFAALAPCQPDGGACESGSDCCGGYCRQTSEGESGEPVLVCIPPPEVKMCSHTDEPCVVASDCCDAKELCINSRCTLRSPPK
jgi:hypothetical protein